MVRDKLMCGHMLALRSKMKARALKECDEISQNLLNAQKEEPSL
jgi:hypothetical protein